MSLTKEEEIELAWEIHLNPYYNKNKLRNRLSEIQNHKCYICGKRTYSPTLDHIIPREDGGKDIEENLAMACEKCNSSRGSFYFKDHIEVISMMTDDLSKIIMKKFSCSDFVKNRIRNKDEIIK